MGVLGDDARQEVARAVKVASVDPRHALDILEAVLLPGLRRAHPELAAEGAYLKARLLAHTGEYSEALAMIRYARTAWISAGREFQAHRTRLGRSAVLLEMGDYDRALDCAMAVLEALDSGTLVAEEEDLRALRAGAHGNLGNARNLMGEHAAAIDEYDVAANLYAGLGNRAKQIEMDANRGIAYLRLGMLHRAVAELGRAKDALREEGLVRPAAKCLIDLADATLLLGDPVLAMHHVQEAQAVLAPLQARPEMARVHLTGARALLQIGSPADAHHLASQSMDVLIELNAASEAADAAQIAGMASFDLGQIERAEQELEIAERLHQSRSDHANLAQIWLLRARIAAAAGEAAEATRWAEAALERVRESPSNAQIVATAHLEMTRYVDDVAVAGEYLAAATELLDRYDLRALRGLRDGAAARIARRAGDLGKATRILRSALREARDDGPRRGVFHLHTAPGAVLAELLDEFISVLLATDTSASRAEAWEAATLSKAWGLNSMTAGGHHQQPTPYSEETTRQLCRLYDERRLAGPEAMADLEEQIRDVECALVSDIVATQVERDAESLAMPPAVPEISVLQFHVIGRDLAAFVLRDGGVESRYLPEAGASTARLLEEWRLECSRARAGAGAAATRAAVAAELMRAFYADLIRPVEDLLVDLDGEPLLLVAHKHLFSVPFEAIDCDGVPLSERFRLRFNAGLSAVHHGDPRHRTDRVLVVGVPDEVAPQIANETEALGRIWPESELLVGAEATRAEVLARAPAADVLHMACHGEFRGSSPLLSGIRLADGWLTGLDFLRLDLTGVRAILSCCDVGRAGDQFAEPIGLVWSLLAAGCSSVIAANWTVDDASATAFMTELHSQVHSGASFPDAVDAARLSVRAQHPHPYHWAAFRYITSPTTALLEGTLQ